MTRAERTDRIIVVPQRTDNFRARFIDPEDYCRSRNQKERLEHIASYAALAPSTHNTQPRAARIESDLNAISLFPDYSVKLPESDPSGRETWISFGASLAIITIAARFFGWNPDTEIVTDEEGEIHFVRVKLTESDKTSEEIKQLFSQILNRVNYDGDHTLEPLDPDLVDALSRVFEGDEEIEFNLVQDQPRKVEIGKLVNEGDRGIFANGGFVDELANWMRDSATTRKDGVLTSVFGLPEPLRRHASRMVLTAGESQIAELARRDQEKFEKTTTAIGFISSLNENPETWVKIGEFYQIASLWAAHFGVYFGARAVLVESDKLHPQAEKIAGVKGRLQMMFRAGYPAGSLEYSPRYPMNELRVARIDGKLQVVPRDKPTIFKVDEQYPLETLLADLGDVEVHERGYDEHWIADLFDVLHPEIPPFSAAYFEQRAQFVSNRRRNDMGVWGYNPLGEKRKLVHLPDPEDYYRVITARNERKISDEAQEKISRLNIGVCGLSGSGAEAAWAMIMSGVQHIRLADFDFISPTNLNRMRGFVGEKKVREFAVQAWEHNPFLQIEIFEEGITKSNVRRFAEGLDVIIEQMDSEGKFLIRQIGKQAGAVIFQNTDMPDPIIEWELPESPDFGGRAEEAGISAQSMRGIGSIQESTAFLPALMGVESVTAQSFVNFTDIVEGRANGYSQLFIGAQSGGGALGRLLVALAGGYLDQLPEIFVVHTIPPNAQDNFEWRNAFEGFINKYRAKYGNTQIVEYLEKFLPD